MDEIVRQADRPPRARRSPAESAAAAEPSQSPSVGEGSPTDGNEPAMQNDGPPDGAETPETPEPVITAAVVEVSHPLQVPQQVDASKVPRKSGAERVRYRRFRR